jgi:hypothetical protein
MQLFKAEVLATHFPDLKFESFRRYLNHFGFPRANPKEKRVRIFKNNDFRRDQPRRLSKIKSEFQRSSSNSVDGTPNFGDKTFKIASLHASDDQADRSTLANDSRG